MEVVHVNAHVSKDSAEIWYWLASLRTEVCPRSRSVVDNGDWRRRGRGQGCAPRGCVHLRFCTAIQLPRGSARALDRARSDVYGGPSRSASQTYSDYDRPRHRELSFRWTIFV